MGFAINVSQMERLQKVMQQYPESAENAINEVLHGEAGELIQKSIKQFMPSSGREWSGKASPAKSSNSLQSVDSNLAVTVKSSGKYNYLYFPDDGTNTRRHAGNKQFFLEGAESVQNEIIERCTIRLVQNFET